MLGAGESNLMVNHLLSRQFQSWPAFLELFTDSNGQRPHTLQPQDLVSAHMGPYLSQQEATLSSTLTSLDGRNADLIQLVRAQGVEISTCLASLEAMIQDIERSASLVQDTDMQLLTEDIKVISQEAGI